MYLFFINKWTTAQYSTFLFFVPPDDFAFLALTYQTRSTPNCINFNNEFQVELFILALHAYTLTGVAFNIGINKLS